VHVTLKGKTAIQDQDALGILGVNLVYGAHYLYHDPDSLLESLMHSIDAGMLEVDMIDFLGPAFENVDNRLMALRLVQKGMTQAAMFGADGKLVQPSDVLYKKAVLVERSRFRPPTHLNINLLDCAYDAFCKGPDVEPEDVIVISEMTLENLTEDDDIMVDDFLQRVDILCALGKNVMVSNFPEFYRLAQYLFKLTNKPVAVALGVPTLRKIFEEQYYDHLEGGILEAFGRMFRNDMRMYVCPELQQDGGKIAVDDMQVQKHLQHLYRHLMENGYIRSLDTIEPDFLKIHADDVLENIRSGESEWQSMVPVAVVNIIRERGLFQ
jgi:hypothetical protein